MFEREFLFIVPLFDTQIEMYARNITHYTKTQLALRAQTHRYIAPVAVTVISGATVRITFGQNTHTHTHTRTHTHKIEPPKHRYFSGSWNDKNGANSCNIYLQIQPRRLFIRTALRIVQQAVHWDLTVNADVSFRLMNLERRTIVVVMAIYVVIPHQEITQMMVLS